MYINKLLQYQNYWNILINGTIIHAHLKVKDAKIIVLVGE